MPLFDEVGHLLDEIWHGIEQYEMFLFGEPWKVIVTTWNFCTKHYEKYQIMVIDAVTHMGDPFMVWHVGSAWTTTVGGPVSGLTVAATNLVYALLLAVGLTASILGAEAAPAAVLPALLVAIGAFTAAYAALRVACMTANSQLEEKLNDNSYLYQGQWPTATN